MDLTPGPGEDQKRSDGTEPFRPGETLTRERAEAVLTAAARELHSGRSRALHGWMSAAVVRWLIDLADSVGPAGSDISDEMTGALALANVVLRMCDGDDLAYRAGREDAAKAVEAAMRAESDRIAVLADAHAVSAPRKARAVEQGIGVAKAMTAVVAAARGGHNTERGSE